MKSFVFPGNIEPEILNIASGQVPYMRAEWFSKLILETEFMLLELIDCPDGKVIPYTSSGTAAMDSCLGSLVTKATKTLVINGGSFGARWIDLCQYYGRDYDEFIVPFGEDPDYERLSLLLDSGKYDLVFMQHHETSSGYLYDIKKISSLCKNYGTYLIVDAISSFLTDPLSMNKDGVDVAILSSHKGLNIPPGLSFVVLSPQVIKSFNFSHNSYYLDWNEQLSNLERGQTPFSPATHLHMQLHRRLCLISENGLEDNINSVKEKADTFRLACRERNWQFTAVRMSNCLTSLKLPFEVKPLILSLYEKNVYVMPSGDPRQVRIAHVGELDIPEHMKLLDIIDEWILLNLDITNQKL